MDDRERFEIIAKAEKLVKHYNEEYSFGFSGKTPPDVRVMGAALFELTSQAISAGHRIEENKRLLVGYEHELTERAKELSALFAAFPRITTDLLDKKKVA